MTGITNFNTVGAQYRKKPVVLLSPLDWGLGHTTRCIPIIHELIRLGCEVIIACNSTQKLLLQQEFPQLSYEHLQGYDLRYGKTRWGTPGRILLQLPKILIKINNENKWLNIFLKKQPVDIIISDNRFGFYSRSVHSVFITHQLYIKTAMGKITDRFVQWLNYRRIARFATCWVPDFKGANALAGELSNPAKLPLVPVQYIGGLSRLQTCANFSNMEPHDLLIILSGPEPQRTIFENKLLTELQEFAGRAVLVRGLPQSEATIERKGAVTIYNHAPSSVINKLICSAQYIISRGGYTTIMDIMKLGKKSIVVPTPGQAEQEYLALYLSKKQIVYRARQASFSLQKIMGNAPDFLKHELSPLPMNDYKQIVHQLVEQFSEEH